MTPWWLRPTAEGAKEEKDRPEDKAPERTPSPEPPTSVAPESVPLTPEALKETSPSLEAEPAWRHEPVPEPEGSSFVEEPEEPEGLRLGQHELIPEELESVEEADEDDDEEEISAQSAESGETAGSTEESKGDAGDNRRRRPRRSRGRGRKEGRTAAPATEPEEEDEESQEPAFEEPATPRRVAVAPSMAPMAPMSPISPMTPVRSARSESYTIQANDLESVAREIIISVPERQRVTEERKIAMFCDLENIALGVRDSDIGKFDIELILERLLEKGKIIVKKAYADWERYSEYKRGFHEAAIELIDIPQKYYSGKNSADIKMVVDAMDLSYSKEHLDTFVILSGDSDFSPLVSKLKENNKTVIGVGVKNSSSALLIDNCDEFLYYEDVWRDSQKGPNLDGLNKKTAEAFSLMIDAIQALIRENKDVLWGSMIKQTMQRKKPSFNEGYYGYPSFSELLEDASRKNIIRLKKDQRSGTYIVTGFATGKEAPSGRR
ncbi:MAG TPA: NYN domain-containing protein [Thermoanaerobaculia bacterium]|nr:NYN domain-containing protein [Thermoanaerobaculia bacterium]